MQRMKLAAIGCGQRTFAYFSIAAQLPERYEIVAAADPNRTRVENAARLSRNPDFRRFNDDAEILSQPKMADVMLIATQDDYHVAPCIAAMEKGYDVLLEKPIANNLRDVIAVDDAARRLGRKVLVCHVLRYTPFYLKVKEIIDSGVLGDIVTVNAREGVHHFHQSHSYVRGHWAVTGKSSPMILAKCCHDMDILHWLLGKQCLSVASYGSLTHFTARSAPPGAPPRCTDGCPAAIRCPYNALLYLTQHKGWLNLIYDRAREASDDEIRNWLKESPWGRCVYHCDNTAVDHQVIAMEFADRTTGTFTMTAFDSGRTIEIYGTRGRLWGGDTTKWFTNSHIIVTSFATGNETRHEVKAGAGGYAGHMGGDPGLILSLYDEMGKPDPNDMHSSLHKSIESHAIALAAEESRVTGRMVDVRAFRATHESGR
jgi:predicted dehydrogenase